MKRKITKILAALALLVFTMPSMVAWGQSDYSTDYTGNVTLSTTGGTSATNCKISISSTQYNGIKAGTSSVAGAVKITVPGGTKYLHLHLAGWNGENVTLAVTPTGYSENIALTSNAGISGNSPFTWNTSGSAPSSANHYKVITFTNALSAATELTFTASSGKRFVVWGVTSEEEGGSSLEESDLALTGAPIALSFDLYNNDDAQVVNYTTSSTGAVTVNAGSFVSISVNETEKTITVTPSAVTNGPQTITVNQAADANYAAGSVSFTVDIADSTPITSGDVTFDAEVDMGTSPLIKGGVTFECTSGVLNNGSEYRLYKNSVTTFSVSQGTITQIAFTCTSDNPASGFANQTGWTTDGNNGTWTGNANSVSFTASGAQVRATVIVVTIDAGGAPTPSFTITNNNGLAYDATEGSFDFTVNNAVTGGTTNVAEDVDWISNATISGNSVTFNTTENEAASSRQGVITLTYTYGEETVSEDVTITQAGNPNTPLTIAEVRAQGTGTVITTGVVTHISTSGSNKTAYIQDNTAAIVVFGPYETNVVEGDEIRVEGSLTTYKGLMEIGSSSNAPTVTVLSQNNTVTPTVMTIADINSDATGNNAHQAKLVKIEEATVTVVGSNNTIKQGDNTIVVYGSLGNAAVNDVITFTGNIGCYNTVQIVNPVDITIQQSEEPAILVDPTTVNVPFAAAEGTLTVTYQNIDLDYGTEIYWYASDGTTSATYDWISASFDADNNVQYTISSNTGDARAAYMKVYAVGEDESDVYSELITFSQGHFVADYATLPFAFDGGRADIENTAGLTQEHLGTDYSASPKLKFNNDNNTISTLVLKINERPGTLSFDIKGNGSGSDPWDGVFKVMVSNDGVNFVNKEVYETGDLTNTKTTMTISDLASDIRYIKWVYDTKTVGNVALGNINLAAVPAGYPLTINGYGTSAGGYVLIASPISTTPDAVGMITDQLGANVTPETSTYDLYSYDENFDEEWRNYRANINSFQLVPGKGYLYASKKDVTLYFNGEMSTGFIDVTLPYNASDFTKSIYLAGNSLTEDQTFYVYDDNLALQTVNYLTLNEDGDQFVVAQADSYTASALQGFFVQAAGSGWTLSTEDLSEGTSGNQGASLLNVKVMRNAGSLIDNAIVSFCNGSMMNKFYLSNNTTRVYIPQGNREMAVVNSAAEADMPVSFKASENGTYTLAIETENVEMNYLHLIDNLTGMDVDLLQTPSYTFEAKTNDYTSRFRLVFKASSTSSEADETFAYYNGSSWTVSNLGEATLQVVDVTGRTVSSETINGNATISLNQTPGVYMLRLVNGNSVKVQKVVVR